MNGGKGKSRTEVSPSMIPRPEVREPSATVSGTKACPPAAMSFHAGSPDRRRRFNFARMTAPGNRRTPTRFAIAFQFSDYKWVFPFAAVLVILVLPDSTTAQSQSNAPPSSILLLDPFGRAVEVPTSALPADLLPPSRVGLLHQFPELVEGTEAPLEIQRRREAAAEGLRGFQFFPDVQPRLMPYLASVDGFGNTALKPGPLFATSLAEPLVQQPKYWLSE